MSGATSRIQFATLWNRSTVYRITGVLDFSHRPVFLGVETRRFGNWVYFRLQVKGEKTPTQLGPLERADLNHWTSPVRYTPVYNHSRPG
jgi:hypothetical protein